MADDDLVLRLTGDATSLHAALDRARKDAAKTAKDMLSSATKAEREAAAIKQKGAQVTAALLTPTERYRKELSFLNKLLKQCAIEQETYNRAVEKIRQKLPSVQKAQEQHNRAMRMAKQITEAMKTPAEEHNRLVIQLNNLLRAGRITRETYNRALEASRKSLPSVIAATKAAKEAQRELDAQVERGKQIYLQMLSPLQHYIRENQELKAMLSAGAISQKEYNFALEQARSKHLGIKTAMERHNDAIARGKALTEQLIPPSQRYQLRLKELNDLYKSGYIHQRTYLRGVRQLRMEFNNISPALQKVSSGLRQFGGSMRMGGYLASAFVTAPLVAFATTGVYSLIEFDKAMTYSLSIAEDVTPKLRKEMEKTALVLSEKMAHSSIELAQAYYELISAGLSAQASMKSLGTVSKFAIAGDMELASSVKQLAKATAAMGLVGKTSEETAQGMARVANVLVQAANMTVGSIEDMTQALVNGAAPQARLLNMHLEDTVAILMHYIQVGESAATSSEHFAIGMRLLGQAASEKKDVWKQQGLDLYTASGQMRKFTDVLRDMQKVYLNLSSRGKVDFLKALGFHALQQRALNPLLADPDAARQIDVWSKKLQNMNALDEVAEKQMLSLSNQLKVFRNALQNVSMEVGTILMPYLNKLIYGAKQLIEYWKLLTPGAKQIAVMMGVLAAAVGPAMIAMGILATIAASVAGALASVVTAVLAIGPPIAAVIASVTALAVGFALLIAGSAAYSYAMSQWPAETQKTMKILERIFHAFEGFLDNLWDSIFNKEFVGHFVDAALKVLQYVSPFAFAIKKAMDFNDPVAAQTAADEFAANLQHAFDRAAGKIDLGKAISDILNQELGVDKKIDDIKKKVEEAMDAEAIKKKLQEMAAGADLSSQSFSSLSNKIHEVSEKFKEQIALEEEQARRGYKKVEQMTSAERELMKLELSAAKERQDLIDKYIKEGLDPQDERIKQAVADLEKQSEAEMALLRVQAARLSVLERQKKEYDALESLTKRYESPMQKFSREAKELKKVFDAGLITTKHFSDELRKLRNEMVKEIKIDFRIQGVEGVEAGTAEAGAALENFLAMQDQSKRPVDLETGKFRDVIKKTSPTVTKSGRSATVRVPMTREQRRASERAERAARAEARKVDNFMKPIWDEIDSKDAAQANRRAVGALSPDELSEAQQQALSFFGSQAEDSGMEGKEAVSAGDSAQTTNKMDILREPLERIAKSTEKMARARPVELKPANL